MFLILNFLAATQDIVVDGWALTMLKRFVFIGVDIKQSQNHNCSYKNNWGREHLIFYLKIINTPLKMFVGGMIQIPGTEGSYLRVEVQIRSLLIYLSLHTLMFQGEY